VLFGFTLLPKSFALKVHTASGVYGLVAATGISWAAGMVFLNQPGSDAPLDLVFNLAFAGFAFVFGSDLGQKNLPLWFWWALMTPLVVTFVYSVVQGPDVAGFFSGCGTGSIFYGAMMGTGFIALFFLGVHRVSNIYISISFIFLSGAVLSASRGVLLAIFLTTVVYLLTIAPGLRFYFHAVKGLLAGVSIFPIVLVFTRMMNTPEPGAPLLLISKRAVDTFSATEDSPLPVYTAGRWEIWVETVRSIVSPAALGFGVGSDSVLVSFGETHPHNLFLSLLLAGGLLSLVPFLLLVGRVFVSMSDSSDVAQKIPAGLGMFWLTWLMFSGNFKVAGLLFYFLAIALLSSQRNPDAPKKCSSRD
jgi:O-antigen ligase